MQRIHTTPRASRGFTLIELMIVVAVIAILGAIAYPSYQEYVRKGRRGEARAALQELMQQQERYMTQFNTYKAFNSNENVPFKKFVGGTSETACQGCSHTLSAVACPDKTVKTCIKLLAEPVPLIPDPKVGSITLTSQGEKDCSGSDKRKCWQ